MIPRRNCRVHWSATAWLLFPRVNNERLRDFENGTERPTSLSSSMDQALDFFGVCRDIVANEFGFVRVEDCECDSRELVCTLRHSEDRLIVIFQSRCYRDYAIVREWKRTLRYLEVFRSFVLNCLKVLKRERMMNKKERRKGPSHRKKLLNGHRKSEITPRALSRSTRYATVRSLDSI